MIINLSEREFRKLNELFNIDESNKVFSEFLLDYFNYSKLIGKLTKTNLYDSIVNYFDISKATLDYFKPYSLKNNIHQLNIENYLNNPYNKNIVLYDIEDGLYKFEMKTYVPFEGFLYKEIEVNDKYYEISSIGYFDRPYNYLTLSYDNAIWMLITPHEINTMKKAINDANGNIITFGLGLGYFAYMCSLKENVNSITIIEKDINIINLFKKHILPKFSKPEKINIIFDDAVSYIKTAKFNYDFAFIDLWRDVDDGLPYYILIKKLSKKHKSTTFSYWIENAMITMFRRCLITLIYENLNGFNIIYEIEEDYYQQLINRLNEILKDHKINNFKDIEKLLSDENIEKLIQKI